MTKFKVGDIVKFTGEDGDGHRHSKKGALYRITYPGDSANICYSLTSIAEGRDISVFEERFELHAPESELERLVRVANEGEEALRSIMLNHPGTVKAFTSACGYPIDANFRSDWRYEIMPKPSFGPFTVGSDWRVELQGDSLKIGCKTFAAKAVTQTLSEICKRGASSVAFGEFSSSWAYSTRVGIRYGEHVLPWADCDRILEALTKAGV